MSDISPNPTSPSPAEALIAEFPPELQDELRHVWQTYLEAAGQAAVSIPTDPETLRTLLKVWSASEFVSRTCIQTPGLLADLLDSGDLKVEYSPGTYAHKLAAELEKVSNDAALATALRQFRRREMVRIAWRDLAGWARLAEVLADLSRLAEACVDETLRCLEVWQAAEWGTPYGHSGEPQGLVVLGMGKLGAWELNFSSDIDLIFAYPEEGETRGARVMSNEEYFIRLGRRVINALDATTAEGFVFRVDMRLRPYGDAGPLAMSFDAMEEYYQSQGREWERYAMIKARVIAGDRAAGGQLMAMLRPFIYRRYLDFGAFESLREMKALISREVARKGLKDNVKLGPGGIREVEFIGQAFQLIRGGREPRLQERPILTVLQRLTERGDLPGYVEAGLREAYVFLRRVENRLQAFADRQTHQLPQDERSRLRLAFSMGYDAWPAFKKDLDRHMGLAHNHFEQIFAAPQAEKAAVVEGPDWAGVWQGAVGEKTALATLAAAGFDDPAEAWRLVCGLRDGHANRSLSTQGRARMDRLMPLLLGAAAQTERPVGVLQRLTHLIETVARRTAYLALLVENPVALSQLVKLCAASPWIAALLARHPILLDELLDPRGLYSPSNKEALSQQLDQAVAHAAPGDLEHHMEALRHFKQINVLKVAAADVMGAMPLMVVSDHLTEIAEVVLVRVLDFAWQEMVARHGVPRCRVDEAERPARFAIVGYGKLGGIELGYGSDLDLVFLHDSEGEQQTTDGAKPLDNAVFFARLGQRIIHILNTRTPSGVLYEVDVRLRPSGAAGLLVSGLDSFADYQRHEAWTWEHQALVRARIVSGEAAIAERFADIRLEVLGRRRDAEELRREVRDMRQRMRDELGAHDPAVFDLKQDPGGIADIEFMVQYGVLAWACDYPALLRFTDNIRLLEGFAREGLLPAQDAELLADAYRAYRARVHALTLQEEPARVKDDSFDHYRTEVSRIWQALMQA